MRVGPLYQAARAGGPPPPATRFSPVRPLHGTNVRSASRKPACKFIKISPIYAESKRKKVTKILNSFSNSQVPYVSEVLLVPVYVIQLTVYSVQLALKGQCHEMNIYFKIIYLMTQSLERKNDGKAGVPVL
jgi:hypothetical protein